MIEPHDILLMDPPWHYPQRKNANTRFGGGAAGHYPLMSRKELEALPVASWLTPNAMVYLWVTGPRIPEAVALLKHWGLRYSTIGFVWIKSNPRRDGLQPNPAVQATFPVGRPFFGIGYHTKSNAEHCLLAYRGKPIRPARNDVSQVIIQPRQEHSRKPDETQYRIEQMYPTARRLEVFARRPREGWTCIGHEMGHSL